MPGQSKKAKRPIRHIQPAALPTVQTTGAEMRAWIREFLALIAPFLGRHAVTLGTGVVCMVICFWMITEGTGEVLVHQGFDTFYDAQANSMMHGHWDISSDAISGEAFVVYGKYYGYFGFTPALPRMLLNLLFPWEYGRWSRLLMLLWIASVIAVIVAFMDEFGIRSSPFLLAILILGSTLLFLCSHAVVYHEAIMTGAALALWAYLFFCRYWRQPRFGLLASFCVLSFLAFFSRLTVGAGPQIASSFLCVALLIRGFAHMRRAGALLDWLKFPSPADAIKHGMFVALWLGITIVTYASVNYAKFGTWLNPAPYQYHKQYDAARLSRMGGSINNLSMIPVTLGAYFGPSRIAFERNFPWFSLTKGPPPPSTAKIDLIDEHSSIPATMPALAILSILGLFFAVNSTGLRRTLPVAAAAFAAGCLILPNAFVAYRYLHDYYPFLVISSILGAGAVQSISSKSIRLTAAVLIVLAGIWSIVASFAVTLRWQREDSWPQPAPQAAYFRMRRFVESVLPFGNTGDGYTPKYVRNGDVITVIDPPATYRYDGRRWNFVSGVPLHQFRLLVKFPVGEANQRMALWCAGHTLDSDAASVVYASPTRIFFCSDHWRHGGTCGPTMEIQPGREYHLRIDADRLNSEFTVTLDGQKVLADLAWLHPWGAQNVLLGKSVIPSTDGGDFTGEIRLDEDSK
jgi:hypothetical protein